MADKGRLSVEQCVKTVLFTETRSVVVTQRRFVPIFKRDGRLHSKQFINGGSLLERKHRWSSSVHSMENSDAVRLHCKEGCSTTMDIQTVGATNIEK
jgi:hypothetical protein